VAYLAGDLGQPRRRGEREKKAEMFEKKSSRGKIGNEEGVKRQNF